MSCKIHFGKSALNFVCRFMMFGITAAAILLLNSSTVKATNKNWNVSSGDWSDTDPCPWNPSPEPGYLEDAYINNSGTAYVTQSGERCSNLYLGKFSTQSGTVIMTGGSLSTNFHEYIGYNGTGTFTQTGGTNSITFDLALGYDYGSGTYNLSGAGQLSAGSEYIGGRGGGGESTGTFTQTGGMNSIMQILSLGSNWDSNGTYILSGTGQLSAAVEHIGSYYGTGTFTQTGGTNTISGYILIGLGYGSSGTYNLNGGTLILRSISKGSGTAAFNFGGGRLQASGDFSTALDMTLTGEGGNANIDTAGYSVTLTGVLSGPGGMNKLGLGTLTLTQDATYTGDTSVEEGALDVMNINTPSAAVSVAAGANQLTAVSIISNSLTIGAGAKIVIKPISGGASSGTLAPVPEPSSVVLLAGAIIFLALGWVRKSHECYAKA
jgi:autotransporter-associated beta strand protein